VATDAFDLSGRVAVVTGAASGIGRATAEALARAGADVAVADVDAAGLAETVALVAERGRRALAVPTDVSSRAAVDALVQRAVEELGRLDVMANVAGIIVNGPLAELDEAELDRILAVNLKGVLFGCQAAMSVMTEQGSGSIVNMTSAVIDQPAPGLGAYAISKAGVAMLTRVAALEGGRGGVRVNAVAPGFVETPMTRRHATGRDGAVDEGLMDAVRARARAGSPLGLTGEPDDVANAVVYLASDASRFVTGQILRPNGGVVMPW
jgi:3-oxoacyl-[acyl-carrier protein] reductase